MMLFYSEINEDTGRHMFDIVELIAFFEDKNEQPKGLEGQEKIKYEFGSFFAAYTLKCIRDKVPVANCEFGLGGPPNANLFSNYRTSAPLLAKACQRMKEELLNAENHWHMPNQELRGMQRCSVCEVLTDVDKMFEEEK